MTNILGALANQISSQFSLGENTNHDLDSIDPNTGKSEKYGKLGDFSQHFDQSAERRYVEEGYLRKDPYNTDPKQFEILMQEPNATVFIKKKMFSSIGENFRPDYMNADEKMYYKALRVLFQNKCNQIGAFEKLSKIQKVTNAIGSVPDQLMPVIFTLGDTLRNGFDTGSNFLGVNTSFGNLIGQSSSLFSVLDRMRRLYAFNTTSPITSWITDSSNLYQAQFGQGTGVIEITNFTNFSTTTSTELGNPGKFSLTISDPYELMLITEWDIEKAISDATNSFYNHKIYQFSSQSSTALINDLQNQLNQIRANRNASPITIKIDPDTLLGKRITAIFDRLGIELPFDYDSTSAASIFSGGAFGGGVSVAPEYLRGGATAGQDGLDTQKQNFLNSSNVNPGTPVGPASELSIFSQLISNIFSKLSLDANSQNAFQTLNKNTNYTRRKLRFNFSGKLIIQPMDTAHIYINSKSRFDTKLLSGLDNMFTGLGMLQNLNNTLTNLKNAAGALNPSSNIPMLIEKSIYVGADFPGYLWSLVRGNFVSENEGTHVFGGVVQSAVDNWADGKFTVSVSGADNSLYFDMGKINFKPGVDVFNGSIFDPLTPFKSSFDEINSTNLSSTQLPELLDENKVLVGANQENGSLSASLVKFKLGRYAGEHVTQSNFIQDRTFDPVTGQVTRVFYAPDGLAYKWKEGIGVFTQFGSNLTVNDPSKVGIPSITTQPFAGQDVMNVLSLLITGVPYNFVTYYKAAIESGGQTADPQSKQNFAHSFLQSLRSDITKNNALWGNFIPFKNLVVDEQSYIQTLQNVTTIVNKNLALDNQIQQLQDFNQKALILGASSAFAETSKYNDNQFLPLKEQIKQLRDQIASATAQMQSENNDKVQQVGDDVSIDSSPFVDSGSDTTTVNADRRYLRRQLNFLTRRMSYDVRANEDKNLFIVDDFYDKDMDILAYEKSLTDGIKLYNSEFNSVRDKIRYVSQLLQLEVFCDSQGHIRCRPPQYNRMPSSVFYRMMYLKQTLNINVFPKFMDDLFKDKLATLRSNIELLENQIRLDCAVLSRDTDANAQSFILGSGATAGTGDSFAFISDETNGRISDINDLMIAANPDSRDAHQPQNLQTFQTASKQFNTLTNNATSTKNIFTNAQKYSAIDAALTDQSANADGISTLSTDTFLSNPRVDQLVKIIFDLSGQRVDKRDYLITTNEKVVDVQPPINVAIDVFKVINDLSSKIKARQKAIKLFYSTIKNAKEFQSLDDGSNTANNLITPGVYGNSHIPEVFEHMIEDETYDDYGLNSGQRFIIKRAQIRTLTLSENPPPYTAVEVQGLLDPLLSNDNLPQGLRGAFPGGGNGLTTAMAVDYDMWRMYGFKEGQALSVPFLSDPVSQCGPYASMLLARNRKNILRGTVTISGNEFMQPGEVVFLEDRQLLFYVQSVTHNFTFGSQFSTTLELSYGHTPGEYIPNVTDIVGKMIYNNRDVADLVIHRQDTSGNEINLGVIIRGTNNSTDPSNQTANNQLNPDQTTTTFSDNNNQVINNILYQAKYLLNSNDSAGTNQTARVELRIYFDSTSTSNSSPNSDLIALAEQVRNILIGQNERSLSSITTINKTPPAPLEAEFVPDITQDTTIVDLSDTTDRRSPSQKAFDAARNNVANGSQSGGGASNPGNNNSSPTTTDNSVKEDQDDIRIALCTYVIDCWIKFDEPSPQDSNGF